MAGMDPTYISPGLVVPTLLARFRVVLVGTTHPGNIGAAARAMKTMGLARLSLVAPARFPAAEATAMASGADDLLVQAEIFPTLAAALAGVGIAVGATARRRGLPWPVAAPRDAAPALIGAAATGIEVALVFGREQSGLTNEEIAHCHRLLAIPSAEGFSSLNLAAAVQILAYEIRLAAATAEQAAAPIQQRAHHGEGPATGADLEGLFQHLFATLAAIDFYDPVKPKRLIPRLRRLFLRTGLLESEVHILRGILTAVDKLTAHRAQIGGLPDDGAGDDLLVSPPPAPPEQPPRRTDGSG
jgi:TrmH family RNA methyltransferase